MIPLICESQFFPSVSLSAALGRPIAEQDVLGELVVASASLDSSIAEGGPKEWMFADWEEYLLAPQSLHPYAAGPNGHDPEIFHMAVRLHPADRELSPPEWAEIAQRLTRVTGLAPTGDEHACRWVVALQARPGRLDVIANPIRDDGTRARQPWPVHEALRNECRLIEVDMGLVSTQPRGGRPLTAHVLPQHLAMPRPVADQSPSAVAAQLATLMCQLADETSGPIASVRSLVERAVYRLEELPHSYGPAAGHRLEWIARRLYGIQRDLEAAAADLPGANQRVGLTTRAPAAPHPAPARRSR
ncbi:hypothetical protein [Streptomyces sp. CC224B]|uniref:hypothetical protein n=1 Tax=Streptomyces sp. CC224B TaxID=3044571 RepID=UPI0024A88D44|nr:hypothetical protein [Streptomyces sp. CC224B]